MSQCQILDCGSSLEKQNSVEKKEGGVVRDVVRVILSFEPKRESYPALVARKSLSGLRGLLILGV